MKTIEEAAELIQNQHFESECAASENEPRSFVITGYESYLSAVSGTFSVGLVYLLTR
jgi:hypothetical protein